MVSSIRCPYVSICECEVVREAAAPKEANDLCCSCFLEFLYTVSRPQKTYAQNRDLSYEVWSHDARIWAVKLKYGL